MLAIREKVPISFYLRQSALMQYLSLPSYGADVSISLLIYASSFAMFLFFDSYSSAGFVILDYGQLPGLPPYVMQPHFSTGQSCTPGVSSLASHFIQCETDTFIRHCTWNIFYISSWATLLLRGSISSFCVQDLIFMDLHFWLIFCVIRF